MTLDTGFFSKTNISKKQRIRDRVTTGS